MATLMKIGILAGLFLATTAHAAEQPLTVNIKRLSMETALRMAQAAITQCRKEGVQIAVTVDITVPISRQKAHTAMAFNSPLSQLEGRFTKPFQVPKIEGLIISAGGLPINIGGNILGGIGVSGAPSGTTDEKCAKAGLDAVSADLEMEGM